MTFVPALQLNADFYRDAVAPLLVDVRHCAALLGWGSDVLGYDTDRSTDHGWGPRLQIFVDGRDVAGVARELDRRLPPEFRGWPVRYGWDRQAVVHRVEAVSLGTWLEGQLGVDPRAGLSELDWLGLPQQQILGVVRGAVYHDPAGELAAVRRALRWYPHDVWLWLIAAQWRRISQEEAFVGRTAEVGDELGSRVLAARLCQEMMRLAFLLEKEYRPYQKWVGTAFGRLPNSAELMTSLQDACSATDYPAREAALVAGYERLARRHNELGITESVDPACRPFHGRPFQVLMADRFADACVAAIENEKLRELPLVGAVDQFVDCTDIVSATGRVRQLQPFYRALDGTCGT